MSAFVLDTLNFVELVKLARQYDPQGIYIKGDIEEQINELYKKNIDSVNYRYKDSNFDLEVCNPIKLALSEINSPAVITLIEGVKLCDCIQYQSCEEDDYYTSSAYKLLDKIKCLLITRLDGYKLAKWGFNDSEIMQRRKMRHSSAKIMPMVTKPEPKPEPYIPDLGPTIIRQIGVRNLRAINARPLQALPESKERVGGIYFEHYRRFAGQPNRLLIELKWNDTYTVSSFATRKDEIKLTGSFNNIYADDLATMIEKLTGLTLQVI